jgi:hypothetical protein
MARPGEVTLVLWSWPAAERLSHRGQSWEPQRDVKHPKALHRFLVDVPAELANEIVRMTPLCKRRE